MASPSVNKVFIAGNLTKDPELRHPAQGTSVVSMSVAVNESYKDKDGEWKKKASFFNVVVWGGQAEFVSKYCVKGTPVFVEGKLQTRSYETSAGEKKYITEINASSVQSLAAKANSEGGSSSAARPGDEGKSNQAKSDSDDGFYGDMGDDGSDEVPF